MKGFLYVLKNPLFSHLFKVGMTRRTPIQRARELSRQTNMPHAFEIAYEISSEHVEQLEAHVHRRLKKYQYNKEFFAVTLETIIEAIDSFTQHALSCNIRVNLIELEKLNENSLLRLWTECYPNGAGVKFLSNDSSFLVFCETLTFRIKDNCEGATILFNERSFSFRDDFSNFFDVKPQKSKIECAPLRLKPQDMPSNTTFRDITGKKYRMGGLIRVDLIELDEQVLMKTLQLAKLSFEAEFFPDTWRIYDKPKKPLLV